MPNFGPSLVMEENVATGWARVELYGDVEGARRHIHAARVALGSMKAYYGVGQRSVEDRSSNGGFYHAWKTLPDGTRIHAITNDGHDTLRIYATPHEASSKEESNKREDSLDFIRIVGYCRDSTLLDPVYSGVIWSGAGGVLDTLVSPVGAHVRPADISDDTRTVVGSVGTYAPFRWTRSEGIVELGFMDPGTAYSMATGVSADGSVIVGSEWIGAIGTVAWRWTSATGVVRLADAGLAVPFDASYKVSPNGKWVVGLVNTDTVNNRNRQGAVWDEAGVMTLIPLPGTQTTILVGGGGTSDDVNTPYDVDDNGMVYGSSNHRDYQVFPYESRGVTVADWQGLGAYDSGWVLDSTTAYIADPHGTAFYFNAVTGEIGYLADSRDTLAAQAAKTQLAVVGNVNMFDMVLVYQETATGSFTGDNRDYSSNLQEYQFVDHWDYQRVYLAENQRPLAWLINKNGYFDLGERVVADISEDAACLCGHRVDDAGLRVPVAWKRGSLQSFDLAFPAGCNDGIAVAVASTTDSIVVETPL